MKKLKLLALSLFVIIASCAKQDSPSVGFVSGEEFQGFEWHIGTSEYVKVVTDLDQAWIVNDYEKMSSFFSDTTTIITYDGLMFDSFRGFSNHLQDDTSEYEWEIVSIYSVDLNPETGGEHVYATLAITSTLSSGDIDTYNILEHYYIIDGKIVWLYQYKQDQPD
jgi:hypothetical protein